MAGIVASAGLIAFRRDEAVFGLAELHDGDLLRIAESVRVVPSESGPVRVAVLGRRLHAYWPVDRPGERVVAMHGVARATVNLLGLDRRADPHGLIARCSAELADLDDPARFEVDCLVVDPTVPSRVAEYDAALVLVATSVAASIADSIASWDDPASVRLIVTIDHVLSTPMLRQPGRLESLLGRSAIGAIEIVWDPRGANATHPGTVVQATGHLVGRLLRHQKPKDQVAGATVGKEG